MTVDVGDSLRRARWAGPVGFAVLLAAAVAAARPTPVVVGRALPVELAVVVHPATPLASLSLAELRQVFLGEQQFWRDGTRITLLVYPPRTPERETALRLLYRMSEVDFRRFWIAKIFRAEVAAGPKIVYSAAMARHLVATIPGTIALLPVEAVDDSVRVLRVNGLRPGEKGYPLR